MRPLAYGLQDVIPESAVAAWGCRAILKGGVVDVVPDRKDFHITADVEIHKLFPKKLQAAFGARGWITKTAHNVRGNSTEVKALDDDNFHIRMSTNASYGYLYISAWMD